MYCYEDDPVSESSLLGSVIIAVISPENAPMPIIGSIIQAASSKEPNIGPPIIAPSLDKGKRQDKPRKAQVVITVK